MKRIYHHHNKWEEVKYKMYDNFNHKKKYVLVEMVIDYFNNKKLIEKWMAFVTDNFKFSCEHNFTNPNMNHVAWLGQASVSAYLKIPKEITIIAWNYLDEKTQERANQIARNEIKRWRLQNEERL